MSERVEVPTFKDRILICVDCHVHFSFSTGEQSFFWSRNLIEPKHCPECRKLRKATAAGNNCILKTK